MQVPSGKPPIAAGLTEKEKRNVLFGLAAVILLGIALVFFYRGVLALGIYLLISAFILREIFKKLWKSRQMTKKSDF